MVKKLAKKTPVIRTFSGLMVNPLALRLTDIDITDIAHSLSMVNRFNGHTSRPLSVAQHSVYVARIVRNILDSTDHIPCLDSREFCHRCEDNRKIELRALLHDSSEAYLGDVTKWLKHSPVMAPYRRAEALAERVIFERFDCLNSDHEAIDLADKIMVRWEAKKGFHPSYKIDHPAYPDLTKYEIGLIGKWSYWSAKQSEISFLDHYRMLTDHV